MAVGCLAGAGFLPGVWPMDSVRRTPEATHLFAFALESSLSMTVTMINRTSKGS